MLICMKCHIDYEEGMDFCPQCGGPLVTKEKPVSGHEDTNEKEEARSKETLICPNCKILYERMQSCVRCGAALVKQIPSEEKEKPKPSEAPGDKEREPEAAEARKVKKGVPPSQPAVKPPAEVTRKEPESLDILETKKDVRREPPEKQPARKFQEDMGIGFGLPDEAKKNFFQTPAGLLGTLALVAVAIYILFSLYSYFTKKVSEPSASAPGDAGQMTSTGTSKPTDQTTTLAKRPSPRATPKLSVEEKEETEEMEKIEGLLDKIRLANLLKDIELFMSCYSDDFENLEGRRKMAVESWRDFDYNELSYNVKGHSISGNTAKARVEWLMKISPRTGGKPEETKTALDVIFKKERGDWKVKEIIHLK